MKMKRIANNVALQTIGYVISGFTNVYSYVRECGYQKRGDTGEFDGYARPKYSADLAQATVQENFRRRGNRRGANC